MFVCFTVARAEDCDTTEDDRSEQVGVPVIVRRHDARARRLLPSSQQQQHRLPQ